MLLVPSLLGSAFMPGASLSLGRSSVTAPAPVVMAVAPKKIAVGVIGTGLVGAELLEQVRPHHLACTSHLFKPRAERHVNPWWVRPC